MSIDVSENRPPGTGRSAAGRVVVGYEGGDTGHDAIAFANRWARATHDPVNVVTVHPGAAPLGAGRVDAEWVAYEREGADRLLAEAKALVADDVEATYLRVDAGSAAHGLSDIVEPRDGEGVSMLVLGSRRTRGMRRTFPGSTGQRLLQGAAAPVAVVPWGYADLEERPLGTVAVAFVDTPEGRVAFQHAALMAVHLKAALRVLTVVPDTKVVPGLGEARLVAGETRRGYQESLDQVIGTAPAGLQVTGEVLPGPVVDALSDVGYDDCDLLVCGSRGYGPVRRVLLGGVSSRVVRHSKVPVILTPRGD
jgi:nucleotide-binding universal stress UspA family protein